MARAYDDDLRRKILEAHGRGQGSFRKLSELFGVSLGYVEKIFRQRAQSGQMERVRYRPGPKRRIDAELGRVIVELVTRHADITIAELQERMARQSGVRLGWSTVRRGVGALGLRLKKVAPRHRTGYGSEPRTAQAVHRNHPDRSGGKPDISG